MEKTRKEILPHIFKMSMLWNVLPYYGFLHEWRRLLEMINIETKWIWEQNKEVLTYLGRDYRRNIKLTPDNHVTVENKIQKAKRSWLDLFLFSFESGMIEKYIDFYTFINHLDKNEVIIIDRHSLLFEYLQIIYWTKEKISSIVPAVLCPLFKKEIKSFKRSETDRMKRCIQINNTKAIVIEKNKESVSLYTVISPTLKIYSMTVFNIDLKSFIKKCEKNKSWKISDWVWIPRKLKIYRFTFFDLYKLIKDVEEISKIKETQFGFNSLSIGSLLKEDYSRCSKYKILFDSNASKVNEKLMEFVFSRKTLILVYEGKVYTFKWVNKLKDLKHWILFGDKIIEDTNNNYLALSMVGTHYLKMILKENEKTSTEKKNFIKDLIETTKLWNNCYVVFNRNDLTLKTSFIEVLNDIAILSLCPKIDVKIHKRWDENGILEMLEHIPNILVCRLETDDLELVYKLMKNKKLIDKLIDEKVSLLFEGIEIKPRSICSKQDQKKLNNEILIKQNIKLKLLKNHDF